MVPDYRALLTALTPEQFAVLGVQGVAYAKKMPDGCMVCAADGTEMAMFADRATAFAAIKQHDLEPMDVH